MKNWVVFPIEGLSSIRFLIPLFVSLVLSLLCIFAVTLGPDSVKGLPEESNNEYFQAGFLIPLFVLLVASLLCIAAVIICIKRSTLAFNLLFSYILFL